MELIGPVIGAIITVLICGGGSLVAYGRLQEKVVTKTRCGEIQAACQINVCKKIDELKIILEIIETKREESKDKDQEEFKAIAVCIARIDEHFRLRESNHV